MVIDKRERKFLTAFFFSILLYGPAIIFEGILQYEYESLRIVNWVWGLVLMLFAFYHFKQYREKNTLIIGLVVALFMWHIEIVNYLVPVSNQTIPVSEIIHIGILAVLLIVFTPGIALARVKVALAHKKLLELIKDDLKHHHEGHYEDVVYETGPFDTHQNSLEEFLKFMEHEEIMFHKKSNNRIALALCRKIIPVNYSVDDVKENLSYIKFFETGEVKVKVSHKDYYRYFKGYDYKEVCQETVLEFNKLLELYKKEGKKAILDLFKIDEKDIKLKYGLIMFFSLTFILISLSYIFSVF